jgi:signal transduction histidine kinase
MVSPSLRTADRSAAGPRPTRTGRTAVLLATVAAAWAVLAGVVLGGRALLGPATPATGLVVVAAVLTVLVLGPVRRLVQTLVSGRAPPDPWTVVDGLATELRGGLEPERTLDRVAHVVAEGTGAAHVAVRVDADDGTGAPRAVLVVERGEAAGAPVPDLEVPLVSGSVGVGSVAVWLPEGTGLRPAEERLVRDIAAGAGPVAAAVGLRAGLRRRVDLARTRQEELQRSRARVVSAHAAERRRVAADIHDSCQQRAAVLAGKLGLAVALAEGGATDEELGSLDAEVREDVGRLGAALDQVTSDAGEWLAAAGGLGNALRQDTAGLGARVLVDDDGHPAAPAAQAAAYHVCLEAVQNAIRHGRASTVRVALRHDEGRLSFVVVDDGTGFDPAVPTGSSGGSGLPGMRARVERLDGDLTVRSGPGGTTVTGSVPAAAGESS